MIYLDSAATSQKVQKVIDAMYDFDMHHYATVHRGVYPASVLATQRYHAVREKLRAYIHAKNSSEIIFTTGTTASIHLVAQSFPKAFMQPEDEILTTIGEHHSNLLPWQCYRTRYLPLTATGTIDLDTFKAHLTARTKLVCIAHISNVTGARHPIEEIIAIAHQHGAKVLIDGAQALMHERLDMQALDADFYAASAHKAFGPTGVGFLYGKSELLEKMPPVVLGGDMVDIVTLQGSTYQPPPLRFEAGTPCITQVIGMGAAIDYLMELDFERLYAHKKELTQKIEEGLYLLDPHVCIYGPRERSAITSFNFPGIHPLDFATFIGERGVALRSGHLCAQPLMHHFGVTSMLRASVAPATTHEDIDNFLLHARDVLTYLR